jgi:MFS family permease
VASRAETSAVNGAGIVQGIALVTFPAASTILTDPDEYDLSSTQYAGLFLPQVITAIAASLLGARLAERYGTKRVYLAGLVAALGAMTLLLVSQFFTDDQSLAYGLLLLATACLGAGFGLTVPALNTFAISLGQKELTSVSAAVAGGVIAFYQLGYGIAAFGVGPLLDCGVELPTVYAFAALVAAAMGAWSFVVARRPAPTSPEAVPG